MAIRVWLVASYTKGLRSLLPVPTLRWHFNELIQLVILIVYALVLGGIKYQTAQSIGGKIGRLFGELASDHAARLVAGVDLFTAVQTGPHIAAAVYDVSITIFGPPRRKPAAGGYAP